MSMTLELIVARGTARGLLNGTATADYAELILLIQLLSQEGDHSTASELLVLAKTMYPNAEESVLPDAKG